MEQKPPRGPQPIAEAIRLFLKDAGVRRASGDERVLRAWTEAAGPSWRKRATPVAFRSGQLTVEVATPLALAELKGFQAEGLRARTNAALGEERVRKVVIKLKS